MKSFIIGIMPTYVRNYSILSRKFRIIINTRTYVSTYVRRFDQEENRRASKDMDHWKNEWSLIVETKIRKHQRDQ